MKNVKIITPENIEVEYCLADLASRTAAALIDSLIQCLAVLLIIIILCVIRVCFPQLWRNYYGWILGISLIICALISYGYFIIMELHMNGQTFGKKFMGLRTIRNNGQPITLKHSMIRNLFRVFIDMFGVGIVVMFFSKEHKRLGDMAASTIVVIEENKTRPVSLEDIQNKYSQLEPYMTGEELELLRNYFERQESMGNFTELKGEIYLHFMERFQKNGKLDEWKDFMQ